MAWQCLLVVVRQRDGDVRLSMSRMNETLMTSGGLIGVYWGSYWGLTAHTPFGGTASSTGKMRYFKSVDPPLADRSLPIETLVLYDSIPTDTHHSSTRRTVTYRAPVPL